VSKVLEENLPAFQKFQYEFTKHIRHPQKNPRPQNVPPKRMKVYNELLFNNIEDVLASCFPISKSILGKRKWKKLVRDFFSDHLCQRPFYRQVPDEFMDYLEKERGERSEDPCYLKSLAHYEWIELVLYVEEEKTDLSLVDPKGDLWEGKPAFTSVLRLLNYPFEVHQIGPSYTPSPKESHYLLFRNPEDEIEFMILNDLTAKLLQLLIHSDLTPKQAAQKISSGLKNLPFEAVKAGALQILGELKEKGAIIGVLF